jgi:hypothetical protein
MAEAVSTPTPAPVEGRRLRFDLIFPTLTRPRQAFQKIAAQNRGVWLTPILILMLAALLYALGAGGIRQAEAMAAISSMGPPPDVAMYYTPEQQAQMEEAMSVTVSPVFVYVFPTIIALLGVWVGWLVVSGILHLVLTLIGGRSGTVSTTNVVAWARLPLAVRSLVQFVYMLAAGRSIVAQGLAGFAPAGEGAFAVILTHLFGLIDLYLLWEMWLLVAGVQSSSSMTRGRAWASVLITLAIVLIARSLIGYAGSLLANLTNTQSFF